ncbi:MAG: hypothetical protein HRT71_07955 [Flavobacteriales bacterium]|nr:hypothetical protein [Flavobacteriales bacterium]
MNLGYANEAGSSTAINNIRKASRNRTKINVRIENRLVDSDGNYTDESGMIVGPNGIHLPHDKAGNLLWWDDAEQGFTGIPEYKWGSRKRLYQESTIVIFQGNMEYYQEHGDGISTYFGVYGLSIGQEMSAVLGHETGHSEDGVFIRDKYLQQEGKMNNGLEGEGNSQDEKNI